MINVEDLSPIAHPLAQKKLLKKLHKTIKKGACGILVLIMKHGDLTGCVSAASKARQVKRGVKEVAKGIRKGERGFVSNNFNAFFLLC